MNRREMVRMVAMAGLAGAAAARGADGATDAPQHHDHPAMAGKYGSLVHETSHCIVTGEVCLSHCLIMLGDGHPELAGCAKSVRDLLAGCAALRQLAAANSPHTAELAGVVAQICLDCEKECRKHEDKHQVCRDCAQACAACAKECQKAAA